MTDTLIKINGIDCTYGLTEFDVDRYDIHSSDSGKSSIDGKSYIKVIRGKNYKINLGWTNITTAEKNYILNAIDDDNGFSLDFVWDNDDSLKNITAAYRGDIKSNLAINNGVDRRWNLSFSVIEK